MLADVAHVDLPGLTGIIVIVNPGGDQAPPGDLEMRIHKNNAIRVYIPGNREYPQLEDALVREPFAAKQQVFFSTKSSLTPYSDPYYLDFGPAYPDFWRVREWTTVIGAGAAVPIAGGLP